ncbi:MAG: hypothetical protein NTY15_04075 [Planctomycetota bacterium]|nr:hypothetical protein [Planctomycetota bacterium]
MLSQKHRHALPSLVNYRVCDFVSRAISFALKSELDSQQKIEAEET